MPRTKSRRSRARQDPSAVATALNTTRQLVTQSALWGFLITTVGAISIIALVGRDEGTVTAAWSLALRQIYGLGAYPVAFYILASGIVLLFWNSLASRIRVRWQTAIGVEVVFFAALGLVHLLFSEAPWADALAGRLGGHVGWAFAYLLVPMLGRPLSVVLVSLLCLGGILLATDTSWHMVAWRIRWAWAQAAVPLRSALLARKQQRMIISPPSEAAPEQKVTLSQRDDTGVPDSSTAGRPARLASRGRAGPTRVTSLPPLDLLVSDTSPSGDDADARMQAQIIQETLEAFGVPAKVVEWHRGPVVTQFGVVPGYVERQDREGNLRHYKIRVSKILSLNNDLALALAASPIRIEAPVPGRHVIGIEVPNTDKAVVGLRGVLESAEFQKMNAPLRVALGRDVSGHPVVADLGRMPHLLLAGATGTGKSACLNALIASLLFFNPPDRLRLLLVDPKRVELTRYNGIPHLIAPVITDSEMVLPALRWVVKEMEQRYEDLARTGSRNLEAYNRDALAKGLEPLPMIVVVIDELADVMLASPDEVERTLCRIAQMARATGIHLVVATQRPSVDVVTGLIKANFPARISFAVTSQVDSRVILDAPGAEKLLGRGDMLYLASDSPELVRIQGCWVSEDELQALVDFWRRAEPEAPEEEAAPPWELGEADEEEEDDLLDEAIALVREHEQASASFLQRQMRIGYPRAARLMDQLERRGIVGPAESGGRSRAVLIGDDEDADALEQSQAPEEQGFGDSS